MMLQWGLLNRLTMKVVPQGIDTIKTSCKGVNKSLMGVQQHAMIIYIIIYFEVTIQQQRVHALFNYISRF